MASTQVRRVGISDKTFDAIVTRFYQPTMPSIGDEVVLPDGRAAVVTDTFHEYGSEAYDAVVLETGEQVWVSDEIGSEAYRAPYEEGAK